MRVNLIGANNKSGLLCDSRLLATILLKKSIVVKSIDFETKPKEQNKADINIFIQNFGTYGHEILNWAKINILIPNQEWLTYKDLELIKNCDLLLCKTKYAQNLLKWHHKNTKIINFTSQDMSMPCKKEGSILHCKGLSCQKGTELLNEVSFKSTIVDPTKQIKYKQHQIINRYLPYSEKMFFYNSYGCHVCPSLCEGWGHYVHEALACGANVVLPRAPFFEYIPVDCVTFIPCKKVESFNNSFAQDKARFPLRELYVTDTNILSIIINYLDKTKYNKKARDFYLESRAAFESVFLDILFSV